MHDPLMHPGPHDPDPAPSPAPTQPAEARDACARCGAAFRCGIGDAGAPCWCAALPPLRQPPAGLSQQGPQRCLCPACLQALLQAQDGAQST